MTRFARAKGSKASNERVPEEATSWSEMKRQLLERDKSADETKKQREADKRRQTNYKAFLREVEEDQVKNATWAEFPKKNSKAELNNNASDSGKKNLKKAEKLAAKSGLKRKLNECNEEPDKKLDQDSEINKAETIVKKKKKKQSQGNVQGGDNINDVQSKMEKKAKKKKQKNVGNQSGNEKIAENSTENDSLPDSSVVKATKQNAKKAKKNNKMKKITNSKENVNEGKKQKKELSEDDLKKLEKKKEKRLRQLEKKKLKVSTGTKKHKKSPEKKPERRKSPQSSMIVNGREIPIAYVDGFPIRKEDAERIRGLRQQMIGKGLPRSEIKTALKLERRKAEKSFARERKKVCFNCRKSGHNLSECPELGKELAESSGTGICFKCGSTEHTHFECKVVHGQEFKFAQCFICREQGHIARQCPDNARGLYPKGGACNVCGDVTHLKRDCPKYQAQQEQLQSVSVDTLSQNDNPDLLDNDAPLQVHKPQKVNKIVKF